MASLNLRFLGVDGATDPLLEALEMYGARANIQLPVVRDRAVGDQVKRRSKSRGRSTTRVRYVSERQRVVMGKVTYASPSAESL